MSSRTSNLNRTKAIAIYRLKQEGYTHRQIAKLTGVNAESVKGLVLLGQRLTDTGKIK